MYLMMTEIGTVARRELRNEDGLVVETAYYTTKILTDPDGLVRWGAENLTEDKLELQMIVLSTYDGRRLAVQETFQAGWGSCRLDHVRHIEYDALGRKSRETTTWIREAGPRTYETHYTEGRETTRMVCEEGSDVIAVTGHVPPTFDPPGGFGRAVGGISLRLAPSRPRGTVATMSLVLTMRNVGAQSADGYTETYAPIQIRDARGRIVPMLPWEGARFEAAKRRSASPSWPDCGDSRRTLAPWEACWVREYEIEELWGRLPAGSYTAVATHCLPGRGQILTSNAAAFIVDP